jgi:hypothetical protein
MTEFLHVFEHIMDFDESEDCCTGQTMSEIGNLLDSYLSEHIGTIYKMGRNIPMMSYNSSVYRVNDYQFTLKSDSEYRYVLHTNFIIDNCGRDKWTRYLSDNNIEIQFYKVPISSSIDDIWIDDDHIPDYVDSYKREKHLTDFMKILRRNGYDQERNDYQPVLTDCWGEPLKKERVIEVYEDDDCDNDMYRKTLTFPDLPDNSEVLDSYLLPSVILGFNRIKETLSELELHEQIQAILCFRTSSQITSGK